jgi:hypothetical protein
MGNFGSRLAVSVPQSQKLPDLAFGADLAGPLAKDAEVASKAFQEEETKAITEKKALDKTEGMLRWADHENTALSAVHEAATKLQTGELDRDQATALFEKTLKASEASALAGISPDLHGVSRVKFEGVAGRTQRTMQAAIEQHQRAQIGGNLESIRDAMLKQATIPGADVASLRTQFEQAASVLGPQAGMDQARLGKFVQDFKDGATFSNYKQRLVDGMGSAKTLQTLEAQIKADPGLDPDKQLALRSSIQGQIATLQHRAAIELERRDRANAQSWQSAVDIVQAGKPLSADFAAELAKTFKGTSYAKALTELVTKAPQTLSFAAQPVRQQEAALLTLQAKGNTAGWSPAEQKQYQQLERVHNATLNDIKGDPWKAALERNVIPGVAPIDAGNLANLSATLVQRTRQADTLAVWAGRDVSPLRPEEARQVGTMLNALPAPLRAETLGAIAKTMKPGQMQAFAAQIGDKLGIASLLASRDLRTDKGRTAAELYLKGVEAVKEKRVTFDEAKQARVREDIRREIEGAYLTESGTNTAMESAFGIYAGLKSEGSSGNVKQAIAIATGGIMSYNGAKIAKPYGWSDGQVKDAVRGVTPDRVRNLFGADVLIGGEKVSADAFAKALHGARLGPSPIANAYSVIVGGRIATTLDGRPLALPLEGK